EPKGAGAIRPIGTLIAVASVALLILPFLSTFGELLTNAAMAAGFDAWLGQWIAPVEGQLVHGALALLGIPSAYSGSLLYIGSVIATVAFLMAFWAFAYNVVLEGRGGDREEPSPDQGSRIGQMA